MEPWVHPTAAALAVGTPVAAHRAASPGAPQSKTQDPEPAAMCRICYGESEEETLGPDRALICPCLCKGADKACATVEAPCSLPHQHPGQGTARRMHMDSS